MPPTVVAKDRGNLEHKDAVRGLLPQLGINNLEEVGDSEDRVKASRL